MVGAAGGRSAAGATTATFPRTGGRHMTRRSESPGRSAGMQNDPLSATRRKQAGHRSVVPQLRHRGVPIPPRGYTITTKEVVVAPGIAFTRGQLTYSDEPRVGSRTFRDGGERPGCLPPWLSVSLGVWALCCDQGCWDPPQAPGLSTCRDNLTDPAAQTIENRAGSETSDPAPFSNSRSYYATRMKERKFRQMVSRKRRQNK